MSKAILDVLLDIRTELQSMNKKLDMMVPKEKPKKAPVKRFEPPEAHVVFNFMLDHGAESIGQASTEADSFVDFYSSKGWKVGSQPMKSWEAAARNWIRRAKDEKRTGSNGRTFTRESKSDRATRIAREHAADTGSI